MNSNFLKNATPATDRQAIEYLDNCYTGTYHSIAISQYKLSRKQSKTMKDSLKDAHAKVEDACTSVINHIENKKLACDNA